MDAIIYIAHGSRRNEANRKFITFICEVARQAPTRLHRYAFLEHAMPSIQQAVDDCVQNGAKVITMVPVFLSPGIHVLEDIPTEILKAREKHSSIQFRYASWLGADEILAELLKERLLSQGFRRGTNEVVLLIGHGSRKKEAKLEFEKLAAKLENKIQCEVHTAFFTTSPFYDEKLKELVFYERIYCLPFLLFAGGIAAKMEKEWNENMILCDPIGFDKKLISLIQKRADLL